MTKLPGSKKSASLQTRPTVSGISHDGADLADGPKLFLEALVACTDANSIDSLRVPCLNGKLAVQEFAHELELRMISGDEWVAMLTEVLAQLQADPFWKQDPPNKRLGTKLDQLSKEPSLQKSGKDLHNRKEIGELRLILSDVLPTLERTYALGVVALLKGYIQKGQTELILSSLRVFLSEMVHRGWTLSGLGGWIPHFIKPKIKEPDFYRLYDFWAAQLLRPPQEFSVTLRLNGAEELTPLANLGTFQFNELPPQSEAAPPAFLKTEPKRTFATSIIQAVDFESAAHTACEAFEHCQDRLRFNFREEPVHPDPDAYIVRLGDGRSKMQRIEHRTPNPKFKLPLPVFLKASARIDDLLREERIDTRSRERLRASTRHYRMGQDAESFRDKFLNWWLGLEFLCHFGDGPIGPSVNTRAVDVLTNRYLWWQVNDLAAQIRKHIRIWPPEVSAFTANPRKVNVTQLIQILQTPAAKAALDNKLAGNPFLLHRVSVLSHALSGADTTLKLLTEHRRRLSWHLDRLYRIRCCLVHGSPIFLKLQLPAANLEFYLREVLSVATKTFDGHGRIATLDEFFTRAGMSWKLMETDLKSLGSAAPRTEVLLPKLWFDT